MTPLQFTSISLIVAILLSAGYYYIGRWYGLDAQREKEYDTWYMHIYNCIYCLEINEKNYDYIQNLFTTLNNLHAKNKEKTSILWIEFLKKFKIVVDRKKLANKETLVISN